VAVVGAGVEVVVTGAGAGVGAPVGASVGAGVGMGLGVVVAASAGVGAGVGTDVGTVPGSSTTHVSSRHEQSMSEVSEMGVLQDAAA